MEYFHLILKKVISGQPRFALLIEPNPILRPRNDKELYRAVTAHGRAVICIFVTPLHLAAETTTLTPQEFEQKWKGD